MSDSGHGGKPPSEVSAGEQIDLVCDRFEAACRKGEKPRIEEFLEEAPADGHNKMLRELLEIELEVRQEKGESPLEEDYESRFPDCADLIVHVFDKAVKRHRLGDYELLNELGRGGMGVIFRARQVHLNQIVAVKILPERFLDEPKAVSRFKREMQSIGALDHPNIVRAYNAGEQGGTHFLAMEYVDGINLHQLVKRRGPVPVGTACEIIRQAAKGLEHAHQSGLVHRDVKPANFMLSRFGVVKILDLGLARLHVDQEFLPRLTQTGIIIGTVGFMAPEQTQDSSKVDIRADIYSLGCTLFFLLTGSPPYGGAGEEMNIRTLRAHATKPIPSISKRCPKCPKKLDAIVSRLLAKEPKDRYATPIEVAKALKPFADPDGLEEPLPDATGPTDQLSTVSHKGLASSAIDTAETPEALRGAPDAVSKGFGEPWYRQAWVWIAVGVVAGLIAVIGIAVSGG